MSTLEEMSATYVIPEIPITELLVREFIRECRNAQVAVATYNGSRKVLVTVSWPYYWRNDFKTYIIRDLMFEMAEQYKTIEFSWHHDVWELIPPDRLVQVDLNFVTGFRFTLDLCDS
jgi:hypothetical protein